MVEYCSSKMWLEMRFVVGHFMARAARLLKCVALPLFMPQRRSRLRYVCSWRTCPLNSTLPYSCKKLRLLYNSVFVKPLGWVPWGTNLWGDPQHPSVRISRRSGSRQRSARTSSYPWGPTVSSGWGWWARTNRAISKDSYQTTWWPRTPPPVTSLLWSSCLFLWPWPVSAPCLCLKTPSSCLFAFPTVTSFSRRPL